MNYKSQLIRIGESEEVQDAFAESVKLQEEFKEVLNNFDQRQKDLVVRALVYYRKLNNKVKLDKGTGVRQFYFCL